MPVLFKQEAFDNVAGQKGWIKKRERRSPEQSKSLYILGIPLNYTLINRLITNAKEIA